MNSVNYYCDVSFRKSRLHLAYLIERKRSHDWPIESEIDIMTRQTSLFIPHISSWFSLDHWSRSQTAMFFNTCVWFWFRYSSTDHSDIRWLKVLTICFGTSSRAIVAVEVCVVSHRPSIIDWSIDVCSWPSLFDVMFATTIGEFRSRFDPL